MRGCKRLRNISPNIFGLTGLSNLDFMDCGGVFMALRDAIVMGTMEDHFSCGGNNGTYGEYLKFLKYCKLDVVARELILQLFVMPVALPGGEVPKYFMHRAYGDSLTVTLPRSSLSQEFLRFNACVVVDFPTKGNDWYRFSEISEWYPFLEVNVGFNGTQYWQSFFEDSGLLLHTTDYLFFCSFKIQPTDRPSKLAFNDVKFKFSSSKRIKECGVRLLNVYPYSDYSDGSSEKEYNQQSGEKCDVVIETERSKKRMRMTSGTSGEYITLPCGQIVADTGLTALNLALLLGQGEASPVSSFPCLVGEALCVDSMITEQQDAEIPILYNLFYHSDTIWRDWRNFGEPKS
ncbi:hypothetical protein ISN45_Aa07g025270 [Arabidopsis thaliana x Arabidopsis arenosa]|uniref:C-JID domain-containing protein n=1 Tax=Arabidopsis thaliana x Arabidopsis arenosa TaxID=1240361 RepID=A0A8T1YCB8_9BRAS|nr:hypothetical protein ISN45_Aa07g025270 [Arabidopsis thaliana x Arabidopsis arenosa]